MRLMLIQKQLLKILLAMIKRWIDWMASPGGLKSQKMKVKIGEDLLRKLTVLENRFAKVSWRGG